MLGYKMEKGFKFIKYIKASDFGKVHPKSGKVKDFVEKQKQLLAKAQEEVTKRKQIVKKGEKLLTDYMVISLTKSGEKVVNGILKD